MKLLLITCELESFVFGIDFFRRRFKIYMLYPYTFQNTPHTKFWYGGIPLHQDLVLG